VAGAAHRRGVDIGHIRAIAEEALLVFVHSPSVHQGSDIGPIENAIKSDILKKNLKKFLLSNRYRIWLSKKLLYTNGFHDSMTMPQKPLCCNSFSMLEVVVLQRFLGVRRKVVYLQGFLDVNVKA